MSKLTDTDKYAIVGMHFHGFSIPEIKESLGKTKRSSTVEAYLEEFLAQYEEFNKKPAPAPQEKKKPVSARKSDQSFVEAKKPLKEYNVSYDHQAVLSKMSQAGIHGEDALRLIEKALQKFENRSAEVSEIYGEAMRHVGARELMIRQGVSGEKGVAIMTEGASTKGENLIAKVRSHQPDYVYHVQSPNSKK